MTLCSSLCFSSYVLFVLSCEYVTVRVDDYRSKVVYYYCCRTRKPILCDLLISEPDQKTDFRYEIGDSDSGFSSSN